MEKEGTEMCSMIWQEREAEGRERGRFRKLSPSANLMSPNKENICFLQQNKKSENSAILIFFKK